MNQLGSSFCISHTIPPIPSVPLYFIYIFSECQSVPMLLMQIIGNKLILSSCAFAVNILIRRFTGSPANYFYTYDPEGISILELFWSLLPVRYLYCSFAVIILAACTCVTNIPFCLLHKKKAAGKVQ